MVETKVEIQIRTIAMDFWASLEHKIYYKFEGDAPDYISRDLRECSGIVAMLDAKMLSLNNAIMQAREAKDLAEAAIEESVVESFERPDEHLSTLDAGMHGGYFNSDSAEETVA